MRCDLHDLLPGQCPCTPATPDYERNRAAVQRLYGMPDEPAPQVLATIVAQPTTDTLPARGYARQLPRIGYGHWGVCVDDSHMPEHEPDPAMTRDALILALQTFDVDEAHRLVATITVRDAA